jgi:hypothetical protein
VAIRRSGFTAIDTPDNGDLRVLRYAALFETLLQPQRSLALRTAANATPRRLCRSLQLLESGQPVRGSHAHHGPRVRGRGGQPAGRRGAPLQVLDFGDRPRAVPGHRCARMVVRSTRRWV